MAEDVKVPEGWDVSNLGKLASFINGYAFKPEDWKEEGLPIIRIEQLKDPNAKYDYSDKKLPDIYLIDNGDLIFSWSATLAIKLWDRGKAYLNQHLYKVLPNSTIKKRFLKCLLEHKIEDLSKETHGSTMKHITRTFLLNFRVTYPKSKLEQRKIAEILETIDNAIEKTDRIIEKYKRIKQGLMQDLFTKGITAFGFEKDKLINAVKKAFKNGDHNFGREENLINHLSDYLREVFSVWDVDSEIEKNKERQRPDIIIHKRRNPNENLFAIEVKKSEDLNRIKEDIKKLEDLMLKEYRYEDAVFIGFNIENFDRIFELSEKVNFILISKDGEVKIRNRVRRFKDSPLGRVPEEWEVVELGNVANVKRGASPRPIEDPVYFSEGGRGWVRILDVTSSNKYLKRTTQYLSPIGEQKSVKVEPNELIMSICATIGKPTIVKIPACIHDGFVVFKNLSSQVDIEYLFYYLTFKEKDIQEMGQIGTQGNLNSNLVSSFELLRPPLPEQHRIASILSQIDEAIEKEKKYKEKLERIKRGLMEDLLTGKVRVNHLIEEGVELPQEA